MKKYLNAITVIIVMLLSGCEKDFENINTDPNKVTRINPSSLLSPVLYNTVSNSIQRANNFTHELMQITAPIVSRAFGVHRYEFDLNVGSSMWSSYYANLTNINDLIRTSEQSNELNYWAIGLIIRAWNTSIMTDAFGDLPYFSAAKANEEMLQPAFDKQEDIYASIMKDLEDANKAIDVSSAISSGNDILFGGDMLKWQKLCNSLRLRLLLRTMNNNPAAQTSLLQILNNPADFPVMQDTEDDAILRFTNVSPFNNPYLSARFRDFSEDQGFSTYFIEKMEELNDPRFYSWATKSGIDSSQTGYDGIVSGYPAEQIHQAGRFSSYVEELQSSSLIGAIMTYAEVEFMKAELALKNLIDSDAGTHYQAGVEAAIQRWELDVPGDYFENPAATFNNTLEQIMFQKYVNYFFTDYQAWFEKRRTGFPDFPLTEYVDNNGIMPSRLTYPPQVSFYNEENYTKAIQQLGGKDDINAKVWWNK